VRAIPRKVSNQKAEIGKTNIGGGKKGGKKKKTGGETKQTVQRAQKVSHIISRHRN